MRFLTLSLALALGLAPAVALAQVDPGGAPPADMRAKMEQVRSDAKTASFNTLSADHRFKVQAIVDKFDAGTLRDPRDAAAQIDAVLTPDETTAVLTQRKTMRNAMQQSMRSGDGPSGTGAPGDGPGSGPPGGGGRGAGPQDGGGPGMAQGAMGGGGYRGRRAAPDAGRFLLTVAADQEKLRDAMRAEREAAPAPQ